MMDITINELHGEKDDSETSSDRAPTFSPSGLEKVPLPIGYSKQSELPKLWFPAVDVNFSSLQQKRVSSKNPSTHFCGQESSPGLSCTVKVGEKRQRNEYGESCNTQKHSNSQGVIGMAAQENRTRFNENKDAERREESGWGKQLHEVDRSVINTNHTLKKNQDALGSSRNLEVDKNSGLCDSGSGVAVQAKTSECAGPRFKDFDKLRKEINFEVGQTWALYDTADGMPRLYAQIRKVSAPSLGLRITYLEPDPDDEKEVQWFEEDLPVSVGKFRLGKNQNTKDFSKFSHLIQCNEGSNTGHFTIIPRKGETWALFKNWDIKWSSEPDSHRKYEYEFVEILSDYGDEAGVFVAYLHKAKGFASVFFRMGTGNADIFRILPHSLYSFSHRVPSFKLTSIEGKDAYELDQAALPETIKEIIVPSNAENSRKSKHQAVHFVTKGKVFQTGQIWSFCSGCDDLPLYYGRIQKISFTHELEQEAVYKLRINRLKATPFPLDVIQWEDKKMPVGCGTFYARNVQETISSDDVSQQIVPETSLDGKEYTILPKIGEVWVIYRFWNQYREFEKVGFGSYDIVEILDDTLDYKVLLLEHNWVSDEDEDEDEDEYMFFQAVKEYKYNEIDGSEPIFTIPKSERLRFSHKAPASRVTKEIYGELKDLVRVDSGALPFLLRYPDSH